MLYGIPRWRPRAFNLQGCLHEVWCNLVGTLVQLYHKQLLVSAAALFTARRPYREVGKTYIARSPVIYRCTVYRPNTRYYTDQIKGEMGGTCSRHWRDEKSSKLVVAKLKMRRELGRFRYRRKNNVKWILLVVVGCDDVDWIESCGHFRFPWKAMHSSISLAKALLHGVSLGHSSTFELTVYLHNRPILQGAGPVWWRTVEWGRLCGPTVLWWPVRIVIHQWWGNLRVLFYLFVSACCIFHLDNLWKDSGNIRYEPYALSQEIRHLLWNLKVHCFYMT
jgi:hypothetical protein